jgi:hypothetical protein
MKRTRAVLALLGGFSRVPGLFHRCETERSYRVFANGSDLCRWQAKALGRVIEVPVAARK